MNAKPSRRIVTYMFLALAIVMMYYYFAGRFDTGNLYTYKEFKEALANGNVESVTIRPNAQGTTGQIVIRMKDNELRRMYVTDIREVEKDVEKYEAVEVAVDDIPSDNGMMSSVFLIVAAAGIFMLFFVLMNRQGGGTNAQMMNFGKSRARMTTAEDQKVTFRDVAGLDEEKQDLEELVDFLRDPAKYTALGARIPKGVLLVGPPGTGKTLIAKAVAGEAGVPFFSISGSDFVEMFVGVGASRVRDLFTDAKENHPCIVFIDEIDAVARRRGAGLGGGHDEREQTLNQLLVEMDGFGVNEGIIVLAATNRVDILDPAILRPGRFDRKVAVGMPDVRGRREILAVHSKNKPLSDDVDLDQVAQTTAGFSGADLENLMNEAAIYAAGAGRPYIIQKDIQQAFIKVGIGAEKRSKVMSRKDKEITAYHESGHAILFHVLPQVGPVYSVSIIPTGMGAAGYTMPLPEKDEIFNTRSRMLEEITVDLGGRVAEEIVFGDITTGASQDIKQATALAKAMVMKYGMSSKMGLIAYDDDSGEVFIGRDFEKTRSYSERTADEIDEEVRNIIDQCYRNARGIILQYRNVLEASARLLLEKEKIGREEFEALFESNPTVSADETAKLAD